MRRLRGKIDKTEGRVAVRVVPRNLRLRLIPNVNFVILDFKSVLVDEQYCSFLVWYEGQVEAYRALFDDHWERAALGIAAQKLIDSAIEYFQGRRSKKQVIRRRTLIMLAGFANPDPADFSNASVQVARAHLPTDVRSR